MLASARLGLPLALLAFGAALAGCAGVADRGPWATFDASARYGFVDGYLQTPRGGQPGTTFLRSPALSEPTVEDAPLVDLALAGGWGNHGLTAGARLVRLAGTTHLDQPLLTQGVTFPAGAAAETRVVLDWYRLLYGYRILSGGSDSSIILGGGAVWWVFDYTMEGPLGIRAHRGYSHMAIALSARVEGSPGGRFLLSAGALCTLPLSIMPVILSVDAEVGYRLWDDDGVGVDLFVGVAFDHIDYEDRQPVPNHILADIGPDITAGFRIRF